jgi:hypothetical protein
MPSLCPSLRCLLVFCVNLPASFWNLCVSMPTLQVSTRYLYESINKLQVGKSLGSKIYTTAIRHLHKVSDRSISVLYQVGPSVY